MSSLFDVTAGSLIGPTTGGTVTQASNKSTTVVLNAESGQITMNGAALGAGAEVSFTVTNSKISATDVVLVNHSSGGTAGAVVTGEQAPIRTQTDRDILALEEAMAVDLHYIYHPVGLKYAVTTVNPNRTVLETVGSWSKVYETKNIGIVRATVVSNND